MTRIALFLVTLFFVPPVALAQEAAPPDGTSIESVELTGLDRDQLSPGLRRDLDALTGTGLSRQRVSELATRIETELPDRIAAVRYLPQADGRTRVVLLVARISDDDELATNINARYVVDHVEIRGIDEERISKVLRDELATLVGERLDADELERLKSRLRAELPDYDVSHRISRGDEAGRIHLVVQLNRSERSRWIPFRPALSKLVYHEEQKWSGAFNVQGGRGIGRVTFGFARGNNDDLIEEHNGLLLRVETVEAGTQRLGLGLEVSRFSQHWRPETVSALDANPDLPRAYRRRLTVEPTIRVALAPRLTFTTGVSAVELSGIDERSPATRVNAVIAAIDYNQGWQPRYPPDTRSRTPMRHQLDASYQLRAARTALNSDVVYSRHLGRATYRYTFGSSTFLADFSAGRITGRAPLFERFSLGDTSTLRGWNKFDISPVGADRLAYQSVEYRYKGFAYFLDTGAVWSDGEDARVRLATGIGFHRDQSFVTFGVPLNAGRLRGGTFMFGVRF